MVYVPTGLEDGGAKNCCRCSGLRGAMVPTDTKAIIAETGGLLLYGRRDDLCNGSYPTRPLQLAVPAQRTSSSKWAN